MDAEGRARVDEAGLRPAEPYIRLDREPGPPVRPGPRRGVEAHPGGSGRGFLARSGGGSGVIIETPSLDRSIRDK
jgi:hypothetical protein